MPVDTKNVKGRRELRYASYDEFLQDAEQLAAGEITCLGNWSPGQVFDHLARSMNASIDGASGRPPLPIRVVASLFFRKRFIYGSLPSGFQITKATAATFRPDDNMKTEAGLAKLRESVERVKTDHSRAPHPVFGKITLEEWDNFSLRHAELHMSFLKPASA